MINLEDLNWLDAECTCECGCRNYTQVLDEYQKLNCQCDDCYYQHR